VVCAGAVLGEKVVGKTLTIDRVQQFDLDPAAAAERERNGRLDIAAAVAVRRADGRERRPLFATGVLRECGHRGLQVSDDERLLEKARSDPGEQRLDRASHAHLSLRRHHGGMQHVRLGRTGLQVSRICLGTMTFGLQCDEETSVAIMDRAAEGGVTFLDTADMYPLGGDHTTVGRTEEIVGRWLRGRREQYVVATKCFGRMGPRPWDGGNSRRHIMDAIDASLRRLDTDFVDLYQLHFNDPNTPIDETLGALDDLVRVGKVRYIGCSNFLAYQLARAIGRSEARGVARFDSVQPRYNLLFREFEREMLPLCLEEGIGVIPYNPIAGGMLSGKHDRSQPPVEGTRFMLGTAGRMYQDRYWHENVFDTVEQLSKLAEEAALPLPTLAVAWVLAHPAITSPIVGASRPDQLDATLAAAETPLEADLVDRLNELTAPYRRGDAPR
jgi:1-deoxyxylulose-5-phosphate synthase